MFDLFAYFAGETIAFGIFEDRFGRERKRFSVAIVGQAEGSSLRLEEDFLFSDGTTSQRVWFLRREAGNRFSGTCADLIGEAAGEQSVGCASMTYAMKLDIGNRRSLKVKFSDVFYAAGNGSVINRATVTKWGIGIGQALIVFTKPPAGVS